MAFLAQTNPSSPAFWQEVLDALALDASRVVPETMDDARHSCPVNIVALDNATCTEYEALRAPCLAFLVADSAFDLLQSLAFLNANATGEAAPSVKAKADWLLVQQSATSLATLQSMRFVNSLENFLAFCKKIRLPTLDSKKISFSAIN